MSDLGLDVQAGLSIAIGGVQSEVRRMRRDLQRAAQRMPIDLALAGTALCPAGGGNFSVSLGGPSQGRKWLIRQLVIGGGAFPYTAAGTGYLYCGATDPAGPGGAISSGLDDFTSGTFPQTAWYSNRQLVVWANQRVYMLISGGTAGTQYFVNGQVEDWPDEPLHVEDID